MKKIIEIVSAILIVGGAVLIWAGMTIGNSYLMTGGMVSVLITFAGLILFSLDEFKN